MATDEAQARLIRESLTLVRERLQPASDAFYNNLFALAPELRDLFRPDLGGQGMRFMTTLVTIAELIDAPEALDREVTALARAHRGIGVRAAHFVPIGSALMVTLGEALGCGFTCELQEAWRSAYERFATMMIERGGFD